MMKSKIIDNHYIAIYFQKNVFHWFIYERLHSNSSESYIVNIKFHFDKILNHYKITKVFTTTENHLPTTHNLKSDNITDQILNSLEKHNLIYSIQGETCLSNMLLIELL